MSAVQAVVNKLDFRWVEPVPRPRRSALRAGFGCRILTAWQQISFALMFILLGAGLLFAWGLNRIAPVVSVLDPVIERFEPDYSVYKIRFTVDGVETAPCHIVIYSETVKWNVRCWGAL